MPAAQGRGWDDDSQQPSLPGWMFTSTNDP